jgi:predicted MPP superfamily phosphohydrolase
VIFILASILIFVSELIFVSSLISHSEFSLNLIGYIHLFIFLSSFILLLFMFRNRGQKNDYKKGFTVFGTLIICSIPTLIYLIPGLTFLYTDNNFFKWIGWILVSCMFVGFLIGIFYGRWNWKVHRIELEFNHLPEEFHEIKLVQISDVHIGSFFNNYEKVKEAIQKINNLNPDYVFFTGDLVNNTADEISGWESIFLDIKAKKGKFSILGNHDYGDYVKWKSKEDKSNNLTKLINSHRTIGFTPLLNESLELTQGFWLIGVENWGKAPFRQSGKLDEALTNVPENHFKLLLSHDPSHFDEQVVNTNIDLTLSGHTHGMQFGIERFGLKWSPVSWKYKKWAGLYKEGNQYLYVNRGFGYIGFPGRVGIYPEITEIILKKM